MAWNDGLNDLTGHINADKIIKNIQGASLPKAYEYMMGAYEHAFKGKGGITANDCKNLSKIVKAYSDEFNLNMSGLADWFTMAAEKDNPEAYLKNTAGIETRLYQISPKYLTGSSTGGADDIIRNEYTGTALQNTVPGVRDSELKNQNTTQATPAPTPAPTPESNTTPSTPNISTGVSTPNVNNSYKPKTTTTTNTTTDTAYDKLKAEFDAYKESLKPIGAAEAAKLYGIDYNEANILKDYNDSTNEYYDNAVKAQNDLRTQYARNNTQYVNQIADAYIDSYRNAAPTATGKGTLAANALSTQLQADSINAANDYGMMQSVNTLNEARAAELKNNPQAAKDYYNKIGTYLSGLSATKNASDVKQYVDQLDAYSQMYAADRSYQSYLAQANAAKYAGLANASATNASSAASNSAWNQIYNYYLTTRGGDSYKADSNIANLLKASGGN